MKTTIYLVRHGQSEGNLKDLFIGYTDIPLTELGLQQAELAANYLKDIPLDAIYSSDLQRAYHTACALGRRKNLAVIKTEKMREIFGGKWEQESFFDLQHKFSADWEVWWNDFCNARCTDGESVAELQQRIVGEVRRIAEENLGKSIAIFCHATPIRVFRAYCDGVSKVDIHNIPWASNASTTVAEYENGKFKIVEYSIDHYMGDKVTALPQEK